MYRDRKGNTIRKGDIVARPITINQHRYLLSFTIGICKKQGRSLILDDAVGWIALADIPANELQKINPDTNLRALWAEWIREFGNNADYHGPYEIGDEKDPVFQRIVAEVKAGKEHRAYQEYVKSLENADSYSKVLKEVKILQMNLGKIDDVKQSLKYCIDELYAMSHKRKGNIRFKERTVSKK